MRRAEHRMIARLFIVCFAAAAGCGEGKSSGSKTPGASSRTIDTVCEITAKQLNVDRSKVKPETSLGDLGADDLDFVELVMELEERFDITIPDDAAQQVMGTDDWQRAKATVTMSKLASMVDEQREK